MSTAQELKGDSGFSAKLNLWVELTINRLYSSAVRNAYTSTIQDLGKAGEEDVSAALGAANALAEEEV